MEFVALTSSSRDTSSQLPLESDDKRDDSQNKFGAEQDFLNKQKNDFSKTRSLLEKITRASLKRQQDGDGIRRKMPEHKSEQQDIVESQSTAVQQNGDKLVSFETREDQRTDSLPADEDTIIPQAAVMQSRRRRAITHLEVRSQYLEDAIRKLKTNASSDISSLHPFITQLEQELKTEFQKNRQNYIPITRALRIFIEIDQVERGENGNSQSRFGKNLIFLLQKLEDTRNQEEKEAAKKFIELIAELPNRALTEIGGKDVSWILNVCWKLLPKDGAIENTVVRIAHWINQLSGTNQLHKLNFFGDDIFRAFDFFGQFSENIECQMAIAALAGLITEKKNGQMFLEKIQDPLCISLILNALNKLSGKYPAVDTAIKEFASFLRDFPGVFDRFRNEQDISRTLNAIGKFAGKDPDVDEVIKKFAGMFEDFPGILARFQSEQSISMILNTLGKLSKMSARCRTAIELFAAHLIQKNGGKMLLESFTNPQDISQSINGLGVLVEDEKRYPDAYKATKKFIIYLNSKPTIVEAFNSLNLSLVVNVAGKMAYDRDCQKLIETIAKRLIEKKDANNALFLEDFNQQQDISRILNGLGAFAGNPKCPSVHPAMLGLARHLKNHPEIFNNSSNPQNFALSINALSKLSQERDCRIAIEFLAGILIEKRNGTTPIELFDDPQDISLVLNGLSNLIVNEESKKYPNAYKAIEEFAKHLKNHPEMANKFKHRRQFALTLNALGKLCADSKACQEVMKRFAKLLIAKSGNDQIFLETFEDQRHIALILNALGKLVERRTNNGENGAVCVAIKGFAKFLVGNPETIRMFIPSNVSLVLNACGKLADDVDCQNLVKTFAKLLIESRGNGKIFLEEFRDPQDIVLILNGLGAMVGGAEKNGDVEKAIKGLAQLLIENPEILNKFQERPQHVFLALNAVGKLSDDVNCQKVIDTLATLLIKKTGGKMFLESLKDATAISLIINGLSTLAEKLEQYPNVEAAIQGFVKLMNDNPAICNDFDPHSIAITVNALSKFLNKPGINTAIQTLARLLNDNPQILNKFNSHQSISLTLNGLGKFSGDQECRKAIEALAGILIRVQDNKTLLDEFRDPRDIAQCLNGLAAIIENGERNGDVGVAIYPNARAAIAGFANLLKNNSTLLNSFGGQMDISLTLNALSKLVGKDPNVNSVIKSFARLMLQGESLKTFDNLQNISLTVNALAKCKEDIDCHAAVEAIAQLLTEQRNGKSLIESDVPQGIAVSLNALALFVKDGVTTQNIIKAIKGFARYLKDNPEFLKQFESPMHISLVLNALCKLDDADCREVMDALARLLIEKRNNGKFLTRYSEAGDIARTVNSMATLVNDVEKYPAARKAIQEFAKFLKDQPEISDSFKTSRDISLTVNAFGKMRDPDCRIAIEVIAGVLIRKNDNTPFLEDLQSITLILNGLATVAGDVEKYPNAVRVVSGFAQLLATHPEILNGADVTPISLIFNAVSKLPDNEDCQAAGELIAKLLMKKDNGSIFLRKLKNPADIARVLNAFNRFIETSRDFEGVAVKFIEYIRSLDLSEFDFRSLASIASPLSGLRPVLADTAVSLIQKIADHIINTRNRFESSDILSVQILFKALARVRLNEHLLALFRLVNTLPVSGFKNSDIETLANLSSSLLPLLQDKVRSNLSVEEKQVMDFLHEKLLPNLQEKIKNYFSPSTDPSVVQRIGPSDTRFPVVSFSQILKASYRIQSLLEGSQQEILKNWWQKLYRQTSEEIFSKHVSAREWNLIAEDVDSDFEFDLDSLVDESRPAKPTEIHPDRVFDELAAQQGLSAPEEGDSAARSLPEVTIGGRAVSTQGGLVYSIFDRLTGKKLPIYYVRLPGKLSRLLLGQTIYIKGEPYRLDGFGGSSMKNGRPTLESILDPNNADVGNSANGQYGKLIAVPIKEVVKGSPLIEKLVKKLFPYRESFYYFKRALTPSTPSVAGTSPRDFVLEGRFRMGVLPDNQPSNFKILNQQGREIKLRPYDGGGFIRESAAKKMPGYRKALEKHERGAADSSNNQIGSAGNLPAQALQHYPRENGEIQAVGQEAAQKLQDRIQQDQAEGRTVTDSEQFRYMTAGKITGSMGIVVPSSDDAVYVPQQMGVQSGQNILLGRAPYDKPNLRPINHQNVETSGATAEFLSRASALQYTYVGRQDTVNGSPDKQNYFFAKGVLTVIPDEYWPDAYKGQDMVISAEDVKTHSAWSQEKQRVSEKTLLTSPGFLVATDNKIYLPGELIAVPPKQQKMLDGDYDGDHVLTISDRPALYEYVRKFEEQRGEQTSLKPPKTHTPALDENGRYQYSRADEILATKSGVLESYSGLQMQFLAQPKAIQEEYARHAVIGIFEGISEKLHSRLAREVQMPMTGKNQELLNKIEEEASRTQNRDLKSLYRILAAWINGEQPPALSDELKERFPTLVHEYNQAIKPQTKWQALLKRFPVLRWPAKSLPRYYPEDPVRSIKDFLTLGIKMGTDAYKSRTDIDLYQQEIGRLRGLFHKIPGAVLKIPYGKGRARGLSVQSWSLEETQRDLRSNPNLAGEVMEVGIEVLNRNQRLPQQVSNPRKRPGGRLEEPPSKRQRQPIEPTGTGVGVKRRVGADDDIPLSTKRPRGNEITPAGTTSETGGETSRPSKDVKRVILILEPDASDPKQQDILKRAAVNYQKKEKQLEKTEIYTLKLNSRGETESVWTYSNGGALTKLNNPQDLGIRHLGKLLVMSHGGDLEPEQVGRATQYFCRGVEDLAQINFEICKWSEDAVKRCAREISLVQGAAGGRTGISSNAKFKNVIFSAPAQEYREYIGGQGPLQGHRLYEKDGTLKRGVRDGRLKLAWDQQRKEWISEWHSTGGERNDRVTHSSDHAGPLDKPVKIVVNDQDDNRLAPAIVQAERFVRAGADRRRVVDTIGEDSIAAYERAQEIKQASELKEALRALSSEAEELQGVARNRASGADYKTRGLLLVDSLKSGKQEIALMDPDTGEIKKINLVGIETSKIENTLKSYQRVMAKLKEIWRKHIKSAGNNKIQTAMGFMGVGLFIRNALDLKDFENMPVGLKMAILWGGLGVITDMSQNLALAGEFGARQSARFLNELGGFTKTALQKLRAEKLFRADAIGQARFAIQAFRTQGLSVAEGAMKAMRALNNALTKLNIVLMVGSMGFDVYNLATAKDSESRTQAGINLGFSLGAGGAMLLQSGPLGIFIGAIAMTYNAVEMAKQMVRLEKAVGIAARDELLAWKQMYEQGPKENQGVLNLSEYRIKSINTEEGKITLRSPKIRGIRPLISYGRELPRRREPTVEQNLFETFGIPETKTIENIDKIHTILLPATGKTRRITVEDHILTENHQAIGGNNHPTTEAHREIERTLRRNKILSTDTRGDGTIGAISVEDVDEPSDNTPAPIKLFKWEGKWVVRAGANYLFETPIDGIQSTIQIEPGAVITIKDPKNMESGSSIKIIAPEMEIFEISSLKIEEKDGKKKIVLQHGEKRAEIDISAVTHTRITLISKRGIWTIPPNCKIDDIKLKQTAWMGPHTTEEVRNYLRDLYNQERSEDLMTIERSDAPLPQPPTLIQEEEKTINQPWGVQIIKTVTTAKTKKTTTTEKSFIPRQVGFKYSKEHTKTEEISTPAHEPYHTWAKEQQTQYINRLKDYYQSEVSNSIFYKGRYIGNPLKGGKIVEGTERQNPFYYNSSTLIRIDEFTNQEICIPLPLSHPDSQVRGVKEEGSRISFQYVIPYEFQGVKREMVLNCHWEREQLQFTKVSGLLSVKAGIRGKVIAGTTTMPVSGIGRAHVSISGILADLGIEDPIGTQQNDNVQKPSNWIEREIEDAENGEITKECIHPALKQKIIIKKDEELAAEISEGEEKGLIFHSAIRKTALFVKIPKNGAFFKDSRTETPREKIEDIMLSKHSGEVYLTSEGGKELTKWNPFKNTLSTPLPVQLPRQTESLDPETSGNAVESSNSADKLKFRPQGSFIEEARRNVIIQRIPYGEKGATTLFNYKTIQDKLLLESVGPLSEEAFLQFQRELEQAKTNQLMTKQEAQAFIEQQLDQPSPTTPRGAVVKMILPDGQHRIGYDTNQGHIKCEVKYENGRRVKLEILSVTWLPGENKSRAFNSVLLNALKISPVNQLLLNTAPWVRIETPSATYYVNTNNLRFVRAVTGAVFVGGGDTWLTVWDHIEKRLYQAKDIPLKTERQITVAMTPLLEDRPVELVPHKDGTPWILAENGPLENHIHELNQKNGELVLKATVSLQENGDDGEDFDLHLKEEFLVQAEDQKSNDMNADNHAPASNWRKRATDFIVDWFLPV